jgi:adenylate kinase
MNNLSTEDQEEDKMDMEFNEDSDATPAIVRQKPNILVTGTPGVGKTSLAKLLAEYIEGLLYINVGELVNDKKLYKEWDNKFNVPIFDEDMVIDYLEPQIALGGNIVDFHTSNFFPERWFDLVVLLRCNNTELYDRLAARGYSQEKITENIDCEIHEVSQEEVYSSYKKEIILELSNEKQEEM